MNLLFFLGASNMQPLAVSRKAIAQDQVSEALGVLTGAIAAAGGIVAIYLFGSAATGKMTDQSDIDFLGGCI